MKRLKKSLKFSNMLTKYSSNMILSTNSFLFSHLKPPYPPLVCFKINLPHQHLKEDPQVEQKQELVSMLNKKGK